MHKYTLKRSFRKTVALEVTKELSVVVRAPVYMPKFEIDRFVESHDAWIEKSLKRQSERTENELCPTDAEIAALKKSAKEYFNEKTAYFSELMRLTPSSIKITSAKKRFGSCSGKNGICFSWRLMLYPEAARDYVIVHELAHIVHKNHGKRFYELISKVLPDYKERRKLLKNH